jgi:hypothetical protein
MENAIKFLPLCFFSKTLEINEYPASMKLLKNALILHFLLGFLVVAQLIDPVEGFLLMVAEILLTLIFVWLAALLTKKGALFMHVAAAFIVCANIIGILSFPFAFWLNIVENERVHLPFYIAAGLMLWYLGVVGFLLHRFLDIQPGNCFSLTLVYFLFVYVGAFGILFI